MTGVMGAGSSAGARRRAAVPLGVLMALTVAGCGLGDRAELEKTITRTPARADAGMVTGTIVVEARFVDGPDPGSGGLGVPVGAEDFEMPEGGFTVGAGAVEFAMDLATSRAALTRQGEDEPFVYMDDLVWYGRRRGVPDDDARPWIRLDLEDLDEGGGEVDPFSGGTVDALAALHPAVITDLVAGSLTGSIKTRDREEIAGVEATRYEVNISIDKALGDERRTRYPEKRRETIDELIEVLGIDGNLHPAQVWIDADGQLRRFRVSLTQRPATRIEFALDVTVDYEDYGGTYTQALPTPQEVLTVDTVLRFIGTVSRAPESDS